MTYSLIDFNSRHFAAAEPDSAQRMAMQASAVGLGRAGGRRINTATLFVRQNTLVYQLTGRLPGLDAAQKGAAAEPFASERLVDHLVTNGPPDPDLVVDYLLRFTLGTTPHPDRRETVRAFLRDVGDRIDRDRITAILALITAMPEYQLA